jgi:phosphate transport system substrate-binding protein
VELTYALDQRLPVADVRNIAGRFVTPSPETVAEAAEDMSLASAGDFARSLLYTTGRNAYPISSYTYLLVFTRQDDAGKGRMLADLLQYMAGPGQGSVVRLHHTPSPGSCGNPSPPRSGCFTIPTGTCWPPPDPPRPVSACVGRRP